MRPVDANVLLKDEALGVEVVMKKIVGALVLLIVAALLSCSNPANSQVNSASPHTRSWVVSTLAGTGIAGYQDSTVGGGGQPQFNGPEGVAVDPAGNVYVADQNNHRIRKITPEGVVSTLAGSTEGFVDGAGTSARFNNPAGVAVDSSGNVYVADYGNHLIRKITPQGFVSTLAGTAHKPGRTRGESTSAQFNNPHGVATDSRGNVYVADYRNHMIRKITPEGFVSNFAGTGTAGHVDGPGTRAQFNKPRGVATDSRGNVYVSDEHNHRVRKITPEGVVDTLAGIDTAGSLDHNTGLSAQLYYPNGVATDSWGNVYVAEHRQHRIRKIWSMGAVSTFAGTGTAGNENHISATSAQFNHPTGVATDSRGNIYVADHDNHRIRKIEYKAP